LLETANESYDHATADLAKNIHASGQMLAKLLEKSLLLSAGDMDEAQMDALRDSIRPTVKYILDTLSSHTLQIGSNPEMDDLNRIRRAADQLLALVGKGTNRIVVSK
jgi:hypothetical protein